MDAGRPAKERIGAKAAPAMYRLNRRAAFLLGGLFLALGGGTALLCFLQMSPQRRLAHLRESAKEFIRNSEWKQAALQLANVVQLSPDDAEAWYQLGTVHLQSARRADVNAGARRDGLRSAVSCYRKAAELDPSDWRARRWLLELDLRGGNWIEARRNAKRLAHLAPQLPLASLACEMVPSIHAGEVSEARRRTESRADPSETEKLLLPLRAAEPADVEILRLLSLARTQLRSFKERDQDLALAEKGPIGRAAAACIRAECALDQADLDAAEQYATEAVRTPHAEIAARRVLAAVDEMRALRDPAGEAVFCERAADQYRAILTVQPGDLAATNNLAWLLGNKLGRVGEGAALATKLLAKTPSPPAALLDTCGTLLLRAGKPVEAVALLERAAVADHDPEVLWRLAQAYCRARRPEAGMGILRDLVARPESDLGEVRRLFARIERDLSH